MKGCLTCMYEKNHYCSIHDNEIMSTMICDKWSEKKKIQIPCPDGIDGCAVYHCKVEE